MSSFRRMCIMRRQSSLAVLSIYTSKAALKDPVVLSDLPKLHQQSSSSVLMMSPQRTPYLAAR